MKPAKYKIAVSGASKLDNCLSRVAELSKEIGKEIARQGCILITGATTGCPHLASLGAKKAGGLSVGFSPAASEISHIKTYRLPLESYDVMVYTGFDYSGRNLLMTRAADGVIIICGRMGTLNEFTIAYEDGKPIGILEGSGGTADLVKYLLKRPHRKGASLVYDKDPKKLIQKLIELIKKEKN
ncbi:MAG: hypothetical protein COS26_01110 [Candidatus Nealsonbacteria bacterium CG02_land_8_20_14_3_00_40_11]|uniref:TIGR00725 family protein n=1 Tax=Candidatus Nealsonbacteria bacterium CG02_land_8_20_14_3_00_40_11 TaxID=1974700 RepID=A0A2M7D857_9BACT|nr:MAG: hypothetical protein COS26_01110 [Candidatus Nealsonbacteria bacterium CG02_land_8_20_14_3_00_40_11]